MWNDPKAPYKDVAASDLYKIAKYDELQSSIPALIQAGIEEYKKAGKEATESSASGNSDSSKRTGKTGEKTAWDMTDKEFEESVNKVMSSG